jgi:hypothetical protein
MKRNKKFVGKVIIPSDVNVWPHELKTAQALSSAGFIVEFVPKNQRSHENSADIKMGNLEWEIKAPVSDKLTSIERNLRRGSKQSENIILDSRRMKRIPDEAILRELRARAPHIRKLKRILLINRHGQIIDIK